MNMEHFFKKHWRPILIIAVMIASAALIFHLNGTFDTRIDGAIYAGQIASFAAGKIFSNDPAVMARVFKPLYGIIGGLILHIRHIYDFILAMNVIFYALLAVSSYSLLRLLDFSENESTLGTIWIVTAYPLLKYGLALGTDISGWFFATATLAIGLYALRKDSIFLLCAASVVGFLGAIAKETGALGLIALGLLIIWQHRKRGTWAEGAKRFLAAALPAGILYGILVAIIAGHAPLFIKWFLDNRNTYSATSSHSIFNWIAVEASAFGLYWLFVLAGVVPALRRKTKIPHLDFLVCAFLATLPVLAWPVFISRILFIQFLWVIPLSLIGFRLIQVWAERRQIPVGWVRLLMVGPIALNVILFLATGGGGSLFHLIGK